MFLRRPGMPSNYQMLGTGDGSERVEPDESVTPAGLDRGADEVGRDIARTLAERFGPSQR